MCVYVYYWTCVHTHSFTHIHSIVCDTQYSYNWSVCVFECVLQIQLNAHSIVFGNTRSFFNCMWEWAYTNSIVVGN